MTKYAMLDDGNIVTHIGTKQDKDNTEKTVKWIQLSAAEEHVVQVGYQWRPDKGIFERVRLPLDEERERILEKNIKIYSDKMGLILSGYDYYEIMTFPYQTQDLINYRAVERGEATSDLWFLPALCQARGLPVSIVVDRLEEHVRKFAKVSGYITGMKQKFEERINYAPTYEMLDELERHLEIWRQQSLL